MSQVHTIVVRFPDGIVPRYSAATEFQGGQVVAVDFDGNRLRIAQELEEALEDMLSGWKYIRETHGDLYGVGWDRAQNKARAALAKARGEA